VHHTLSVEQVGLHHGVARVDQTNAIDDERVAIKIRLQRVRRDAPDALFILLHRQSRRALVAEEDLLRIGSAEAESDPAVRVYLR
jgi:hypothetical protein